MSARPIASICCWPPLKRTCEPLRELRENREELVDTLEALLDLAVPAVAVRTEQRFFSHAQAREDVPAFRHVADAEVDDPVRLRPVEPRAGERDRLGVELDQPHQRAKRRRLPGAVRADDPEARTSGHVEARSPWTAWMWPYDTSSPRTARSGAVVADWSGLCRRGDRLGAHARLASSVSREPEPRYASITCGS